MKNSVIFTLAAVMLNTTVLAHTQAAASIEAMSWDEVLVQAKREGSLTFNVWYLQPQWRSFVKQFEDEYGIKVRIPEGTIDGNMNKLLAESKREKGKINVIALSISQLPITQKAGAIRKVDWIPNYTDAIHQLQSIDTQGYAIAFWGNQTGFAYDPIQMEGKALPQ